MHFYIDLQYTPLCVGCGLILFLWQSTLKFSLMTGSNVDHIELCDCLIYLSATEINVLARLYLSYENIKTE